MLGLHARDPGGEADQFDAPQAHQRADRGDVGPHRGRLQLIQDTQKGLGIRGGPQLREGGAGEVELRVGRGRARPGQQRGMLALGVERRLQVAHMAGVAVRRQAGIQRIGGRAAQLAVAHHAGRGERGVVEGGGETFRQQQRGQNAGDGIGTGPRGGRVRGQRHTRSGQRRADTHG